ncbi:MAG: helix-turn-helix transcriptional regulator [Alistipes sp.]|nr:helix-turn-helix transcriptional regulator [Alistipes sp.]
MHEQAPKIAVVTQNVLMNIGLKAILERIIPMAEVCTFSSVAELRTVGDVFFHHFVSAQIFAEESRYFLDCRHKPIILTDAATALPMSGIPCLNIGQSETELVKSILRLHQAAHNGGYPADVPTVRSGGEVLSARETEVLALVVKGLLNKEIADRLNIGLTTVISHRRNIVEKLGIKSVSGLTIYAVMHGYVSIDEI